MRSQTRAEALERLRPWIERAHGFSGWDFDWQNVDLEPGPPWDYEQMAADLLGDATSALDMGTGGGELLSRLAAETSARLVASEEWEVNAPVAARRLHPLGVDVVHCQSVQLPFRFGSFDVIINRHEELDPATIGELLRPGGRLLTQQIGGDNWREVGDYFPRMVDFSWVFPQYVNALRASGLDVRTQQHSWKVAYPSLGEVVYMLALTPWHVPDLDLERDLDALLELQQRRSTAEGVALTFSRDLIEARKPS